MFTLFQVMTLESWGEIARAIWAEPDRQFMLFVILFFIAVCSFAIMNTVMAVIVEHTLGEAVDQKSDIIKKAEEELQKQTEALLEIFLVADTDGGGTLNKSEFTKAINNSETRKLLQKMDLGDDMGSLDTEEIAMLFDTIDVDRNTELCPQEFVNGMMQMRGGARARRVFELQCSVLKLGKQNHNQISQIHNGVRRLSGRSPVEPTSPQLEEALTPNSIPTPVKIVKSSNPQSALTSQTALTQLEEKIEASLAKQKAAVLDLEGKLDLGLGEVNKQLNALLHALPQPAA
jgi:Ca2+-binding EF-hand superfamily protein